MGQRRPRAAQQPGVDVKAGDFLLEVDGVPLETSKDPWAAFVGTAGQVVSLTISSKPTKDGTERTVLVKPESGEGTLRYRNWIERNRAYVEQKSEGKIGYIYVPNTGVDGQNDLFRQFFGQKDKAALIIDERWNGGGQIPHPLHRSCSTVPSPTTGPSATGPTGPGHPIATRAEGHAGQRLAGSGGDMFRGSSSTTNWAP